MRSPVEFVLTHPSRAPRTVVCVAGAGADGRVLGPELPL